jgi:hypothetical protein
VRKLKVLFLILYTIILLYLIYRAYQAWQTDHITVYLMLISLWLAGVVPLSRIIDWIFHENTEQEEVKKREKLEQETPSQKSNNKEKKMEGESKPVIIAPNSVISIDQKGGITAHTVNLAPQARRVTPEQRAILLRALKPLSLQSIKISYGEADPEQKQFAEDLTEALRAAGCILEVSSALHMTTPYEKGLTFEVNSTPPYPRGSDTLQKALNEAHIDSQWVGTPDMKRDVIWMVVGKRS